MIPVRIRGANLRLAAPSSMPECSTLWIRAKRRDDGCAVMSSRWEPTPEDLALLAQGGLIEIVIAGTVYPPIAIRAVRRDESLP